MQISTPHWKNHSFMAISRCVGGDVMLKQEQGQTVETQSTHYMPYSCNSKSRCYFNLWDRRHVCPVSQWIKNGNNHHPPEMKSCRSGREMKQAETNTKLKLQWTRVSTYFCSPIVHPHAQVYKQKHTLSKACY